MTAAINAGPTPASDGVARIDRMAAGDEGQGYSAARLLAMQGKIDEARRRLRSGLAYLKDRGLTAELGGFAFSAGDVQRLAGELEAANRAYAGSIAKWQA